MKKLLNIKTAGAFLLSAIMTLMFVSKTIYSYNLPVVTGVLPVNGKLNKSIAVSGSAFWAEESEIYAEFGGKIEEIFVAEGDVVLAGDPIMRLSYDQDSIRQKLDELAINKNKLLLEMEKVKTQKEKTEGFMADLNQETYRKDLVSEYELKQLQTEISKAETELEQKALLYETGAIPRQEYLDAQYQLNEHLHKESKLKEDLAELERKAEEQLTEQTKQKEKQLREYGYDLTNADQNLQNAAYDLSQLALEEAYYQKKLQDYQAHMQIVAPESGTILSLPPKQGQEINDNALLAVIGIGSLFEIEFDIPVDNNFILPKDICKLSNPTHSLKGTVWKITPSEQSKKVTVRVESGEITAGETFEGKFEKESGESYVLVPNNALNKDNDGYFLYQIKRRDGILGKEFYTEKLRVWIGDSDGSHTVIDKGVTFFEPVVLLSDKAFTERETVRMKNEGDFFEK